MSVRHSPEVVEYFRATGRGCQTRMNGHAERMDAAGS
ncbi:BrnA antitoxin family protein [Methylobacter tundripaludum]